MAKPMDPFVSVDGVKKPKWTVVISVVGLALVWGSNEVQALMGTSGGMVGFDPRVIGALPMACILSFVLVCFACSYRSVFVGACSVLPIVILGLPFFYAYQLGIYGWSNEIRIRSDGNELAVASVDFSEAVFQYVPYKDHERMVAIEGFQWSSSEEPMTGAKDGTFYGFKVNSVPHVYICPLRNGARGVAWVTDASKINTDLSARYEPTGVANWYIWTM